MSAGPIPGSVVIMRGPLLVTSRSFLAACALEVRERKVADGGSETDVEKPGFSLCATRRDPGMTHNNSFSYAAETVTGAPAGTGCRDLTSPIAFAQMLHGLARRISPGAEMGVRPKPMAIELPAGQ
jgi:hypothetical protein